MYNKDCTNTGLQENYTTAEKKHDIMTMQCNNLNALQKCKQTS